MLLILQTGNIKIFESGQKLQEELLVSIYSVYNTNEKRKNMLTCNDTLV